MTAQLKDIEKEKATIRAAREYQKNKPKPEPESVTSPEVKASESADPSSVSQSKPE